MPSALILFILIFASFAHASDYDPNATRNQRPGVHARALQTASPSTVSIRAASAPAVIALPNTPLNGTATPQNPSLLPPNAQLTTGLPAVNSPQGQVPLVQIPGANGVPVLVPADAASSPAALQNYLATHPYMAGRIPLMNRYNPCPAPGTPCNYLVPGSGVATQQMAPQSAMPMGGLPNFGGLGKGTPNFNNNLNTPGTNGSPYNSPPAYNNAPVNSGPDGLCSQPGLFQTTKQAALGDRSPCDVILDTILKDPCTADYASRLGQHEPEDMEAFCPGFGAIKNDPMKRALALQALAAAIVKTESGWQRLATGDGGKSKGYFQLTTLSDVHHGCSCSKLKDEFDQIQNLQCGTQMIVSFMEKDHTVGKGSGSGSRGIARSFGPFRDHRGERDDIKKRTSAWCKASFSNGNNLPAAVGVGK